MGQTRQSSDQCSACDICSTHCHLSAEQHECYRRIPKEIRPVWDASFADAGAKARFFGAKSRRIDIPGWRSLPDVPEKAVKVPHRVAISKDDERHMFLQYNYARSHLLKLIGRQRGRATKARALAMLEWHDRMQEIRGDLVNANMSLVMAMARRMRIPSSDFPDLISEGNMALLRSIERFDVSRGFKFSTYACRAILKGFARQAGKAGTYHSRFGVSYDPEMEFGDYDDRKRQEHENQAIDDMLEVITGDGAYLTDIERTVVIERFGLQGRDKGKTLAQVGRKVGLSTERVRQLQKEALGKIRKTLNERHLVA